MYLLVVKSLPFFLGWNSMDFVKDSEVIIFSAANVEQQLMWYDSSCVRPRVALAAPLCS